MGGRGSGRRYHFGAKDTTSDYRHLDVRRLQRKGLLSPGQFYSWQWSRNGETVASIRVRSEAGRIILSYRSRSGGEEWQDQEYPILLDWTSCNYGGKRAWFRCPARGCGRRVAILYGGKIFACRHCYQLAYACQRESPGDRASRQADTIRERLGWEGGILNGPGLKPKGMRWRTYERLYAKHEALVDASLGWMELRFGISRDQW